MSWGLLEVAHLYNHPIAWLVIRYALTHFFHNATELVTEGQRNRFSCNWVWCRWTQICSALQLMQV
jgi:hypothetical protein